MPKVFFKNEELEVEVPVGKNLRALARENKIEIYPYLARFANCRGFGQCGTCRVRVQVTDNRNGATAEGESSFRVAR